MLRRVYNWVIELSEKKTAPYALGAVSFAESSFFPIPPDVMLVPMCLAQPHKAWFYALVTTIRSVAGGLLGYAIGALLLDTVGQWIIGAYGYGDKLDTFQAAFAQYGAWIILIKGFLPIPFKLITIACGIAKYNLLLFVLLATITRGGRFFLVAGLLRWKGEQAREFIERRLGLVTLIFGATVVGGVLLVLYAF